MFQFGYWLMEGCIYDSCRSYIFDVGMRYE